MTAKCDPFVAGVDAAASDDSGAVCVAVGLDVANGASSVSGGETEGAAGAAAVVVLLVALGGRPSTGVPSFVEGPDRLVGVADRLFSENSVSHFEH